MVDLTTHTSSLSNRRSATYAGLTNMREFKDLTESVVGARNQSLILGRLSEGCYLILQIFQRWKMGGKLSLFLFLISSHTTHYVIFFSISFERKLTNIIWSQRNVTWNGLPRMRMWNRFTLQKILGILFAYCICASKIFYCYCRKENNKIHITELTSHFGSFTVNCQCF